MEKLRKTDLIWKKIVFVMGVWLIFICIHVANTIPYEPSGVEIENIGEKADQAEGVEIMIQKVVVDGKEYPADQIFKGWHRSENGELFDKEASGEILNGIIPSGHSRMIIFSSNRWQGKVKILEETNSRIESLFSDVDSGEKMIPIKHKDVSISSDYIRRIIIWSLETFVVLCGLFGVIEVIRRMNLRIYEEKFIFWFESKLDVIFLIFVSILAVYARYKFMNYKTDDYLTFLEPWYNFLKEHGGILGLKYDIGNYTEGYMLILALLTYLPINPLYTIKMVSIVFDFALAILGRKIIKDYWNGKSAIMAANIVYTLILFSPTIFLNSAYWGQCDSIYTFFVLLSLYCAIKKRWNIVFIVLGCGLAFKMQTILIFPVFLILYLKQKEFSIFKFFLVPITYLCWSIPALLEGKPVYDIIHSLLSYGEGTTFDLTYSFNNFYTLVQTENLEIIGYIRLAGIALTVALVALSMMIFAKKMSEVSMYTIVSLGVYFLVIITYFLPGMHERYLYVGDVLCIIWWILSRKKEMWYIPVGILMISTLSCLRYITNVWPGEEWNIITEINGIVCIVYFVFMIKALVVLYTEIVGGDQIEEYGILSSRKLM